MADPILRVDNLSKIFDVTRGLFRRKVGEVPAVADVSFQILPGEILGLVGESGCGKTTTGRTIMRGVEPTGGHVYYQPAGRDAIDLPELTPKELKAARREIRMIFQDPYSSLNPRMNVMEIVSESLTINNLVSSRGEIEDLVADMMRNVGLDPMYMRRFPHAFSGGQRQRIAIARALVVKPKIVIADEPVSALDVSIQAQILNLLRRLKQEMGLTYLFIAHNLAVVEHMCDRVAVMYLGHIVEIARTRRLFHEPKHPYTEALLGAVPIPDPKHKRKRIILQGEVADIMNLPSGCHFHPRCRYAQDVCKSDPPPLLDVSGEYEGAHQAACHFRDELSLRGVGE
jgi:peptide/nickel transport system ATP-binding protein